MERLELHDVSRLAGAVLDEVEVAVVGKRRALTLVLAAILAGGHVLLEDFPGLGKTLAARSFAQTLGLNFARAQFTPDLLPSDLTGSFVYDQRSSDFSFRRGPLFAGLLLADEINRTPPRTQSALLEAMQERQITVEGQTFVLEPPFHVLATANPIEYEGTYPLPEAQLDRFMMRTSFGYPSGDEEWDVLRRRMDRRREEQSLRPDHRRVDVARDARSGRTGDGRRERGSLLRRTGDGDADASPRADGGVTARVARASPRGARVRSRRRSRLRDARGCQGGGRAGVGPSHHREAGDVDERGVGQDGRGRGVVLRSRAGAPGVRVGNPVTDVTSSANSAWRPSVAHFRSAVCAVVVITVALIGRRPDLLVIATPMAVVTVWSLLTRPTSPPTFDEHLGHSTIREGEATTWHGECSGADEVDIAVASIQPSPWMDTRPSCGAVTVDAADGAASLAIDLRSTRWGWRPVETVSVVAISPWAAIPLVDHHDAARLDHTAPAGTVRHRRVRPTVRRADRAASIGTCGRRERVRRNQTVSGGGPDASDQLASIGPDRRAEGQFDVGGRRHPRGAPDRRHRRLRCQRGDRRPRVESRRGSARRWCDRRALCATRRPRLTAHVRNDDDALGATRHGAGPAPPNPRGARPGDARELLADRVPPLRRSDDSDASTLSWS